MASQPNFTLQGRVLDRDGHPVPGLRIEAWDKDLLIDDFLGEAVTDLGGEFRISFSADRFQDLCERYPDVYFKVFDQGRLVLSTIDSVLWNLGRSERSPCLDIRLPWAVPPTAPGPSPVLAYFGRLWTDQGGPAASVRLGFFALGFGGRDRALGEEVTDATGAWRIEIPPPDPGALLDVRALLDDGEVSLFGLGRPVPQAGHLDLVMPAERLPPPLPEYARLVADLKPRLQGASLADAREDDERQDLTLLHRESGWDARLIALAASAERLAARIGISPAAAYALVRTGLPADGVQLARVGPEGVAQALEHAVAAGVVALSAQEIASTRDVLATFGRAERRKLAIQGSASSYGSMLAASGLDDAQQDRFDALFSAHTGDADALWQKAREAGLPADQLQLTAQLGALTLNSARLVESLREEIGSTAGLTGALVGGRLYRAATWEARLQALAGGEERVLARLIPTAYVADSVAERLQQYAADLAYAVRRSYPMQVLAAELRAGDLPVGTPPIGSPEDTPVATLADDLSQVLEAAAAQEFRLGLQPLDRFLREHAGMLFSNLTEARTAAVTAELKTLYRQYQMTASDVGLVALRRANLHSAYDVSALPQRLFVARHGDAFPTRAEAVLTWQRAQQISATTLHVVTLAKQLDANRSLPALALPEQQVATARADLIAQYPTLETLFGSLDFCACQHCRSVLSPAAYLVDLLKFLDDASAADGKRAPYDVLTARRPDLPQMPLTCENTNTELPYIDIVIELLERHLLQHAGLAVPAEAWDTGDALSADLIAEPQNLLPAAYDLLLREARYPLAAPFDLWLATARAFTGHFEVPFWQLLEALRLSDLLDPATGYGRAAVAWERLGLGPAERALLTTPASLAAWPTLFGYADAPTAAGELISARTLARRLGVSYHELTALLQTRFVNPTGDLGLRDPPDADPCSWEHTQVRHGDDTPAGAVDFTLLNLLVRLWRRLGWSLAELDAALVACLPTDPDPRTLPTLGPALGSAVLGLSRLAHLGDLLGAGRAGRTTLPVLWAPLSDDHYAALFLTGPTAMRNPVFQGTPGAYLTAPELWLRDHRETVQGALRLRAEEVDAILADAGMAPADAPLNLATISLLQRHGLLARLLAIGVADLIALKDLSGIDPFRPLPAGPIGEVDADQVQAHSIRFVELALALRAGGLSIADLDYLVRHRFDPVGPFRAAAAPPLALMQTLAAQVARIRAEHAVPDDALTFTDDRLARSLGLVLEAAVVTAFLAAWTAPGPDTALPPALFDAHLRRQVLAGVGEVGFLDEADLPVLFDPTARTDQDADANRRALLARRLMPYVQQRLIRRAVIDTLAADIGGDPALLETLLTNPALLADPDDAGRPLLDTLIAATARGLTATDGRLSGYLEVPITGGYRFEARCEVAGTTLELLLDHLSEPLLAATVTADDLAPAAVTELRAGVPYGFTLRYPPGTAVALWVRGQQLPETPVGGLVTYPRAGVEALHRRHLLLTKVQLLIDRLALVEVELRHLLTHRADFGDLDLATLPTATDTGPPAAARARFQQLLWLVDYARLRGDLAAAPADLIGVLAHARRLLPADTDPATAGTEMLEGLAGRLAAITRRAPETVRAAADLLGFGTLVADATLRAPDFAQPRRLTRLWRILALANRLGVEPAALGRWATPTPDAAAARDLRDTLRARYEPAQWRQVVQPIADRLRQQRRDALVAQVLQTLDHQRTEQLFEHFLVDPGTEPVVLTSRLRLAISSVQTFIQRCLLNLEPEVAPSSLPAERWEWMKRYRVWEANRKIFLWPENWLEPELRDDKTHLFAELESALLESDLGAEAVDAALHQYLRGLEEIARLDIRAIYRERRRGGDVVHVVARTLNAPHRYFYRTWSHRAWTPWAPVSADIESDHVALVVWRDRVHLFWVQFLPCEGEPNTDALADTRTVNLTLGQFTGLRPRRRMDVLLYWSDLFQGAWRDPIKAEPEGEDQPKIVNDDFNADRVFMWADVIADGGVLISLLGEGIDQSFAIRSPYAPVVQDHQGLRKPLVPAYRGGTDGKPLQRAGQGRWHGSTPRLAIQLQGNTTIADDRQPCDLTEDLLARVPTDYRLVLTPPPAQRGIGAKKQKGPTEEPFFMLDRDHSFFVEPEWFETTIAQGDQAVAAQPPVWHAFDPPAFWDDRVIIPAFPLPPEALNPPPIPAVPIGPVGPPVPLDLLTRPEAVVTFDGQPIGATGRLRLDRGDLARIGPDGALVRTDLPSNGPGVAGALDQPPSPVGG